MSEPVTLAQRDTRRPRPRAEQPAGQRLLPLGWFALTATGIALTVAQAAAVLAFAGWQYAGLRQLRRNRA